MLGFTVSSGTKAPLNLTLPIYCIISMWLFHISFKSSDILSSQDRPLLIKCVGSISLLLWLELSFLLSQILLQLLIRIVFLLDEKRNGISSLHCFLTSFFLRKVQFTYIKRQHIFIREPFHPCHVNFAITSLTIWLEDHFCWKWFLLVKSASL